MLSNMSIEIGLGRMIFEAVLSCIAGGIVGYERAHKHKSIGVRSFAALSLLGTIIAWIGFKQIIILPIAIIAVGLIVRHLLIVALKRLIVLGTTTSFAMLVSFTLGLLLGYHDYLLVALSLIALLIILYEKRFFHYLVYRLTDEEIKNGLEFGVLVAVLYPLAPDCYIDPFGLINLKKVLLIVILVSSINFFNLIIARFLGGNRSLEITGLIGGLVHSEATAVTIALHYNKNPALLKAAYTGIVLSNAAMLIRNLAIVGFIMPMVMLKSLPSILAMELILIIFAFQMIKNGVSDRETIVLPLSSPFAIKPALRFGLIFLILTILTGVVNIYFGEHGVYLIALLGGISFAGAIVASVSTLAIEGSLNVEVAAFAVVIACGVAQLNKLIWTSIARAPKLTKVLLKPGFLTLIVGVMIAFI